MILSSERDAAAKAQIVFYEAFAEEECELRKALAENASRQPPSAQGLGSGTEAIFTPQTIQESGDAFPPAPIISVRTQSQIPPSWAPMLRGIITRSTGYDHIQAYHRETGVPVPAAYLPEYAARAVAEQAMLLWTALLRRLPKQQCALANFARDGLTGRELRNRRLTVVGVGHIGGEIVGLGFALGMAVVGVDLAERPELIGAYGLKYLPLAEGVARADVLATALPLTDLTPGLLGYETLKHLPRGAVLVNVGRGEVTPPADLLRLLDEGILDGVGLDVYDHEPSLAAVLRDKVAAATLPDPARDSVSATLRLLAHPRALCTPHNAFNTAEAVVRKSRRTVENLRHLVNTGTFLTPLPQ
jgi:D-lactate dehydrogenase